MASPEVIALIADACLRGGDLAELIVRYGVSDEDAAVLREGGPRLAVYRRLVRGNLIDVTHKMLARTRARAGEARGAVDAIDAAFEAFLVEVGPRTHFLRDVPHEFFAWAAPRWRADPRVPAWLVDVAADELAEFAVSAAPDADAPAGALGPPALDHALIAAPACRLLRLQHAVHRLPPDENAIPEERLTLLLLHRDAEHRVRRLELTPFAADVTEAILAGRTLGEAVRDAAKAAGTALTPELLADVAALLADLAARGILLGAAPA